MDKKILKLYFICGTQDCSPSSYLSIVEEALSSGVTCFQFREKGPRASSGQETYHLAKQVQQLCQKYQVPFIVNDDVDLAIELDADGVHIGQEDMPVSLVRELLPDKTIGLSVGNEKELEAVPLELVDYVGVGPIFPTPSKEDACEAIGIEGLARLRQLRPSLPIVAIGGIGLEAVSDILQAGADGLAVISAISKSKNIKERVSQFLDYF